MQALRRALSAVAASLRVGSPQSLRLVSHQSCIGMPSARTGGSAAVGRTRWNGHPTASCVVVRGMVSTPGLDEDGSDGSSSSHGGRLGALSWDELRAHLASAAQTKNASAEAKASLWARVTGSGTRVRADEWAHPSGVASFWLLRHAEAPTYGGDDANVAADPFDPAAPMGDGPNADVLAVMVQQANVLYGVSVHPALPVSAAGSLVSAAAAKMAPERPTAIVSLPGLCAWVRNKERWNDPGGEDGDDIET